MPAEPLHGLRVIDFGTFVAGPLVARLLGDAGAAVTRIVQPGYEDMHAYADPGEVLSRGKTTRCLDLKTADGAAAAWELLSSADVLIESFRPGVMARLGFGRTTVLERHPRFVYLSLPGYSSDDPERRSLRAFDASIMAECGVFTDMGLNRVLMGVNPSYSTLAMASLYSAALAALAAVLALLARESSGKGEALEVPLAAGLCEALVYNSMEVRDLPQRYLGLRNREIARRRERGQPMNLSYPAVKALLDPFFHTYTCRDGRAFYVVAVAHAVHQERCLRCSCSPLTCSPPLLSPAISSLISPLLSSPLLRALGVWEALVALGLPRGDCWRHR